VWFELRISNANLFVIGNHQGKTQDDAIVNFKIYNLYNFQSFLIKMFSVCFLVLCVFFFVFLKGCNPVFLGTIDTLDCFWEGLQNPLFCH